MLEPGPTVGGGVWFSKCYWRNGAVQSDVVTSMLLQYSLHFYCGGNGDVPCFELLFDES
jgi:hypothetical protein